MYHKENNSHRWLVSRLLFLRPFVVKMWMIALQICSTISITKKIILKTVICVCLYYSYVRFRGCNVSHILQNTDQVHYPEISVGNFANGKGFFF